MSGPCFAMHYLVFFHFCNRLAKERRAWCFTLLVLLMLSGFDGSVSLPHGVIVAFPGHTRLLF